MWGLTAGGSRGRVSFSSKHKMEQRQEEVTAENFAVGERADQLED